MEKLLINTPQNVQIEYGLASVGNRFLALVIDYAVMAAYVYLVFYFVSDVITFSDRFLFIGMVSFLLLPVMLYHFILESFFSGQTLGKKLLKIKVVRLQGERATIYEYFIRWVMNIVDIWMLSGVIGLLSIVFSKQSQRLGDMAAGTTVINLKTKLNIHQTVYEDLAETYHPVYPEYMVNKLSDNDINLIKKHFRQAYKANNVVILQRLADKITEVTGLQSKGRGYEYFINDVIRDHYHYNKDKETEKV